MMTRVHEVNTKMYFNGCSCHLGHNTANKAADAFAKETVFDAEEMAMDLFYWFDKSTKIKCSLKEYILLLCDTEYTSIVSKRC